MKKKMNNTLIVVSLVSALALLSYVLYYNVDRIGQTVEEFFVEAQIRPQNKENEQKLDRPPGRHLFQTSVQPRENIFHKLLVIVGCAQGH